jgi:uncharacterized membrane protein (DUF2068 family)
LTGESNVTTSSTQAAASDSHALSNGLRTVALLEAAKGAVVLLVGFGLLSLAHHDVQEFAERLVAHTHLNPAARYPHIFINAAAQLTDSRLWLLAAAAGGYSFVRFIEAYGLWFGRRWAEWFAALSGAVYIPFELLELGKQVSTLSVGALTLNLVIVGFMAYTLYRTRAKSADTG